MFHLHHFLIAFSQQFTNPSSLVLFSELTLCSIYQGRFMQRALGLCESLMQRYGGTGARSLAGVTLHLLGKLHQNWLSLPAIPSRNRQQKGFIFPFWFSNIIFLPLTQIECYRKKKKGNVKSILKEQNGTINSCNHQLLYFHLQLNEMTCQL